MPALVPLLTDDPAIKAAKGVRTAAQVRITDACETGEVQFTETGISGIPVFQVSAAAARRLSNGKQTTAVINFLPEYNAEQALAIFRRHEQLCYEDPNATLHSLFDGIVPSGIASFLIRRNGFSDEKKIRNLDDRERVCRKLLCPAASVFRRYRKTLKPSGGKVSSSPEKCWTWTASAAGTT